MRHRGIVAKILIFLLLCAGVEKGLEYLLRDDTTSYTRIMLHELHHQEELDRLFVGSSHCYRSLDPEILDAAIGGGTRTFNGGSSYQTPDGAYQLIREAASQYDLKEVYVELYYGMSFEHLKNQTEMTRTYILADYMRPSLRKYVWLLQAGTPETYINSLLPARRDWRRLGEPGEILTLLRAKRSEGYLTYEGAYVSRDLAEEAYIGRGYVENYREIPDGGFVNHGNYQEIEDWTMSEDVREMLEAILAFCRRKGIGVTFFSAPMPEFLLAGLGDYDGYIDEMRRFLAGYGASYYDFNLCRPEYLSLEDTDYMDTHHLNVHGARKFSEVMGRFLAGELQEETLFYPSYAEKIAAQPARIYGLTAKDDPADGVVVVSPVTNAEISRIEYEVERLDMDGSTTVVSERSARNTAPYPEESCTYRFSAWLDGVKTNEADVLYWLDG